jgi:DNA processing protein
VSERILAPRWIVPESLEWPERFAHLQAAPAGVWMWGRDVPTAPAVAVVGSRRATLAGLDIARCLGRDLADAGIQVVSGMARGIDGAAHRGCLDAGGSTVAVLGCGIDICYPAEHEQLRAEIVESGCVISEEPRAMEPFKHNFPKRNRLIAALASAVVVVEGTARSGALSTARWAADMGREILAVPGSIRARQSEGTNLLIRDGVRPLLSIQDLFEAVSELQPGPTAPTAPGVAPPSRTGLSGPLAEILSAMGPNPVHPDALSSALNLTASVLASRLVTLELAGAVLSLPGGLVARTFEGR